MMLRRPRLRWRIAAALLGVAIFVATDFLPRNAAFSRVASIGNELFLYRVGDCYLAALQPRGGEDVWRIRPSVLGVDGIIYSDEARVASLADPNAPSDLHPVWYGVRPVPWKGSTALIMNPRGLRWFALALLLPLLLALNRHRRRRRRWRRRVCMTCAYPVHASPSTACPECGSPVPAPYRGNGVSYRVRRPRYLLRGLLALPAILAFAGFCLLPVTWTGALLDVVSVYEPPLHVYRIDEYYLVTTGARTRTQNTMGTEYAPDGDALLRHMGFEVVPNVLRYMSEVPVRVAAQAPPPRTWFGAETFPWSSSTGLLIEPRRARWLLLLATLPLLIGLLKTALRARRRSEGRCRKCGLLESGDAASCARCNEPSGRQARRRLNWLGPLFSAAFGIALFVGLSRLSDRTQSLGLWARIHDIPLNVFALKQCLIFTTRPRAWDLEPDELAKYRDEEAGLIRALVDDSFPMPWYGVQAAPWKGSTATVIDRSRVRWAALIFGVPLLLTAIGWAARRRDRKQTASASSA